MKQYPSLVVYFAKDIKKDEMGQRKEILKAVQRVMQEYSAPPPGAEFFPPIVFVAMEHYTTYGERPEYVPFLKHLGEAMDDSIFMGSANI